MLFCFFTINRRCHLPTPALPHLFHSFPQGGAVIVFCEHASGTSTHFIFIKLCVGSKHHEQLVTQHVLECSEQLADCNYDSIATLREQKTIPECRAKNEIKNKMKRKPAVTKKKGKKIEHAEFDALHVISDPNHFMSQTRWRKPANKSNKNQPRQRKEVTINVRFGNSHAFACVTTSSMLAQVGVMAFWSHRCVSFVIVAGDHRMI